MLYIKRIVAKITAVTLYIIYVYYICIYANMMYMIIFFSKNINKYSYCIWHLLHMHLSYMRVKYEKHKSDY